LNAILNPTIHQLTISFHQKRPNAPHLAFLFDYLILNLIIEICVVNSLQKKNSTRKIIKRKLKDFRLLVLGVKPKTPNQSEN
jgi:hypothetical protein